HHRAQLAALEKLHGHEHDVAALADVVDGDDVGMVEPARRLGFLVEARLVFRHLARVERHVDGLDRDRAVEQWIARAVDDAHGALAELGDDLVAAEGADFHAYRLRPLTLRNTGPQSGWPASLAARSKEGSIFSAARNSLRHWASRPETQ